MVRAPLLRELKVEKNEVGTRDTCANPPRCVTTRGEQRARLARLASFRHPAVPWSDEYFDAISQI
jgi:hypothetical protein